LGFQGEAFDVSNGGRDDALNVCVILTDGSSNITSEKTVDAAIFSRATITIAIGDQVNMAEIEAVASKPSFNTVFTAQSYKDLASRIFCSMQCVMVCYVQPYSKISQLCFDFLPDVNECESNQCGNGANCIDKLKH
jgi:hypothetical protein